MTKTYENMKTEKRRAKQGERIIVTKPYENAEYNEGRIFTVEESIPQCDVYFEHVIVKEFDRAKLLSDEYEVIIEDKTEALHKEIGILRTERDDARKKLKTLNDGIGDYRTRIERQEAAIQSLQDELKVANDNRDSLELTLNEIRGYNADWQTENVKLRDNIHLLQNRLDNLREDHAASEDHLCEKVGHERKLAHSLMDYIRGLEVGVK